MIELIAGWIACGIFMDIITMKIIANTENDYWDSYCLKNIIDRQYAPTETIKSIFLETPWYCHLLILIMPPAAVGRW